MTALRCMWQVTAGMLLGEVDSKHTRCFEITSTDWDATENKMALLLSRSFEANAYATWLQLASASGLEPNWVKIDFVWM